MRNLWERTDEVDRDERRDADRLPEAVVNYRYIMAFMGHGRALETYLIGLKFLYGITILQAYTRPQMLPLADLAWKYEDWVLAAPFFVVATTQLIGLVLNCRGHQISWVFRATGAFGGMLLWSWLGSKAGLQGAFSSGIFPVGLMSYLASAFLFFKAWNNLPTPGAPGLVR